MKKKLITIILALVCAFTCALGLVACGKDKNEVTALYVARSGEQPTGSELTINVAHGETPDLNYRLYTAYKNGDKTELLATDSNLTVTYYYSASSDPIDSLPDDLLVGRYTISYKYKTFEVKVLIEVARANKAKFTVTPDATTWRVGDKLPNADVKNPEGIAVKLKTSDDPFLANDDNGTYTLYMFSKSDYLALTEQQKYDYDYISEYAVNHAYSYQAGDDFDADVGEYMLVAAIEKTFNYEKVVSQPVGVTVLAAE